MIGDGFCNDEANNENCNYDGGDCCGYTVNTDFCSDCKCYVNGTCVAGTHPLVGDGFCHDETNNAICNYDGGDCCVNINADHCIECKCYHEDNCVLGYTPSVVWDGFCNDETNNANCYYDGGDCCKFSEIIDLQRLLILIYFFNFLGHALIYQGF